MWERGGPFRKDNTEEKETDKALKKEVVKIADDEPEERIVKEVPSGTDDAAAKALTALAGAVSRVGEEKKEEPSLKDRVLGKFEWIGAHAPSAFARNFWHAFSQVMNKVLWPLKQVEIGAGWVFAFIIVAVGAYIFIGLVNPKLTLYAMEETDGDKLRALQEITTDNFENAVTRALGPIDEFLDFWQWKTYRQFVEPEHVDKTWYGIDVIVEPEKEEFRRNERVRWRGTAVVGYFEEVADETVTIECDIEDGTDIKVDPPNISISILAMRGSKVIRCSAKEIETGGDKDATMTLKFPFMATASLQVFVMDEETYLTEYEYIREEITRSEIDVESLSKEAADRLAAQHGVDPNERAESSQGQVVIGAEIVEYQPLIKGETVTLKIMVWNKGKGNAKLTDIIIKPEGGLEIPQIEETLEDYYFGNLAPITPDDQITTFYFDVHTDNFVLNPQLPATGARIEIDVTYDYNITKEVEVEIEIPPELLEGEVPPTEEEEPAEKEPLPPPPQGHDSRRGLYVEYTGAGQVNSDLKNVYTGKITENQGGAKIPFKGEPGETLKSITDQIAAQYNIDPALLAAIEAEETGMHYVNRGGELCKPEDTGFSYLTGCNAQPDGCIADCSCHKAGSTYSDKNQIECTADTLREAYDDAMDGETSWYGENCKKYNDNPNNVWQCIFCTYRGGAEDAGKINCKWQKTIINYYKTWKKAYMLGELS